MTPGRLEPGHRPAGSRGLCAEQSRSARSRCLNLRLLIPHVLTTLAQAAGKPGLRGAGVHSCPRGNERRARGLVDSAVPALEYGCALRARKHGR
jgi:hypothetical protein